MTRLEYRLHEIDTVLGGMLVLPAGPGIMVAFIAAADDAPDELSTIAILAPLPPLPFVSAKHHGQLALMVRVAYAGHLAHGEQALAPLRALATPLADGDHADALSAVVSGGGTRPRPTSEGYQVDVH